MVQLASLFSGDDASVRLSSLSASFSYYVNHALSQSSDRIDSFVRESPARWTLFMFHSSGNSTVTLGALLLLFALTMILKGYWQPSAPAPSPDSSVPNSLAKDFKSEHEQLKKASHRWRSLRWIVAIATLLLALILALSLGLTLGRGHHPKRVENSVSAVVDLGYSTYQGNIYSEGVSQWLGIRYAAPPTGNLRFEAPRDPVKNSTLQKANKHGPTCLGTRRSVTDQPVSPSQSEDCLFLDVYAPANATENSRLPVYFFIQGGGFNANANANFNGTSLVVASGMNIVVVTFNYRVGVYGFLASKEIENGASLNNGLKDQRKALQWVQDYISKFGGNPKHVVMGGASAGAASVTLQLAAYSGRDDGLFHATAAESQSFGAIRTVSESQYQYDGLLQRTRCTKETIGSDDTLACLRNISTAELQKQNIGMKFPGADRKPLFPYNPTLDHDFLQDYTIALFESGRFVKLPAIYGDVSDEGTIFVPKSTSTRDQSNSFIRAQFPVINNTQLGIIQNMYPTADYPYFQSAGYYWRSTSAAYGELRYVCPGNHLSSEYYSHNSSAKVYNYHYNVADPASVRIGFGVPHVTELNAIWALRGAPASYRPSGRNANVIPLMQGYWTSFIRFFDPNVARMAGSPLWEEWGGRGSQRRLRIQGGDGNSTTMEAVSSAQQKRCETMIMWGVELRQ